MSDALQPALPPKAWDLIKEGTPKPQTPSPLLSAAKPEETPAPKLAVVQQPKAQARKDAVAPATSLVSVYVRLPGEISQALLKASSERKIAKLRPFTQQDIVAEAVQNWLQKNNYLPHKG